MVCLHESNHVCVFIHIDYIVRLVLLILETFIGHECCQYKQNLCPCYTWLLLFLLLQQPSDSPVVVRVTDTTKYTGSHKLRFDEEGKGKGMAGRDSLVKGRGHVTSVAAQEPYVQGFKPTSPVSVVYYVLLVSSGVDRN